MAASYRFTELCSGSAMHRHTAPCSRSPLDLSLNLAAHLSKGQSISCSLISSIHTAFHRIASHCRATLHCDAAQRPYAHRTDPIRPGPIRPAPHHVAPYRTTPIRSVPALSDPVQSGPARSSPSSPTRPDSIQSILIRRWIFTRRPHLPFSVIH